MLSARQTVRTDSFPVVWLLWWEHWLASLSASQTWRFAVYCTPFSAGTLEKSGRVVKVTQPASGCRPLLPGGTFYRWFLLHLRFRLAADIGQIVHMWFSCGCWYRSDCSLVVAAISQIADLWLLIAVRLFICGCWYRQCMCPSRLCFWLCQRNCVWLWSTCNVFCLFNVCNACVI